MISDSLGYSLDSHSRSRHRVRENVHKSYLKHIWLEHIRSINRCGNMNIALEYIERRAIVGAFWPNIRFDRFLWRLLFAFSLTLILVIIPEFYLESMASVSHSERVVNVKTIRTPSSMAGVILIACIENQEDRHLYNSNSQRYSLDQAAGKTGIWKKLFAHL